MRRFVLYVQLTIILQHGKEQRRIEALQIVPLVMELLMDPILVILQLENTGIQRLILAKTAQEMLKNATALRTLSNANKDSTLRDRLDQIHVRPASITVWLVEALKLVTHVKLDSF
jgi:hypothetical protein